MIEKRFIDVFEMVDGSIHRLPFMIKRGPTKGPKLFLTAVIHGEEVTGMEVVHRIFGQVRLERGAIYAFPAVNLAGFQFGTRYYPYADITSTEQPNLNLVFPGKIDGAPVERVANAVYRVIGELKPDLLVDLHCDAHNSIAYILLERSISKPDEELGRRTRKLAEVFGVTVCTEDTPEGYVEDLGEKTVTGAAYNKLKIPCFTVELGGPEIIQESFVRAGTSGLKNVLDMLGMLKDPWKRWESVTKIKVDYPLRTHSILVSHKFGKISYKVKVGQFLRTGELVATIEDIFGDKKEELRADEDGFVLALGYQVISFPGLPAATLAVKDETGGIGSGDGSL